MIYIKACKCYVCGNLFELKKAGYTIANKYVTFRDIFLDERSIKKKIAICEECSNIMFSYINNVKRVQGEKSKESEKRDCEG